MFLIDYFKNKDKETPSERAKDRLRIIVAQERSMRDGVPDFLPKLKLELIEVISKYTQVSEDQVKVQVEQKENNLSLLELNITFND